MAADPLAQLRAEHVEARQALAASDMVVQTMAALPLNMHVPPAAVKARVGAALALNRRLAQRVEALAGEVRRAEMAAHKRTG